MHQDWLWEYYIKSNGSQLVLLDSTHQLENIVYITKIVYCNLNMMFFILASFWIEFHKPTQIATQIKKLCKSDIYMN